MPQAPCTACRRARLALIYLAAVGLILLVFGTARAAEEWKTDFSKRSVGDGEILSGGPPKDGIPPIDEPEFLSIEAARDMLRPEEPVIALVIDGEARAYPLRVMIWHEIVNDEFKGVPVAVTFCPLCNAAIVFDRRFDGRLLDFGTTGKLRNSDLIMYDRQTESWWQQFVGEAIVGELTGGKLTSLPAQIVGFADFSRAWPYAEVLSQRTGFNRDYGDNPYVGYDDINRSPFAFVGEPDPRLPPMERVLAVRGAAGTLLFPFARLGEGAVLNEHHGELPLVVLAHRRVHSALDAGYIPESRQVPAAVAFDRRVDGRELTFKLDDDELIDEQTGSEWNVFGQAVDGPLEGKQLRQVDAGVHFAFAWLAFDPQAVVYAAE